MGRRLDKRMWEITVLFETKKQAQRFIKTRGKSGFRLMQADGPKKVYVTPVERKP